MKKVFVIAHHHYWHNTCKSKQVLFRGGVRPIRPIGLPTEALRRRRVVSVLFSPGLPANISVNYMM